MFVNKNNFALLTDLYELTMAQVYLKEGMDKKAVFNFYIRPSKKRSFFLNAGLEHLLFYLENIKFNEEELNYLKEQGFEEFFIDYLRNFKFQGDVYAIEEGEVVFANEPIVQIEASLPQAQIVETFLINALQYPILVATKAIRCVIAGEFKKIMVDFGLRRAHGTDAGMKAARASFIGGFLGTSNVLAGKEYKIPIAGTMAHSFILSYFDEVKAFESFAKEYPKNAIFLLDTFDTLKGLKNALKAAKNLNMKSFKGVRLDSGDLVKLSKQVREILDNEGYKDAIIVASGSIDEYKIKEHIEKNAPIDSYGVGTKLIVSSDLPYLDCAYKLVEYDNRPVMKLSPHKETLPSKKQIFRKFENGRFKEDTISLFDEKLEGEPILKKVMENGKVCINIPSLKDIKEKALENVKNLPEKFLQIGNEIEYIPKISKKLQQIKDELKKSKI